MAKNLFQKFFIFNMITDSFLEEEQGTLERVKTACKKRVKACKNLWNLDFKDSIRFGIFQVS